MDSGRETETEDSEAEMFDNGGALQSIEAMCKDIDSGGECAGRGVTRRRGATYRDVWSSITVTGLGVNP